jgi:hypothetical protein
MSHDNVGGYSLYLMDVFFNRLCVNYKYLRMRRVMN